MRIKKSPRERKLMNQRWYHMNKYGKVPPEIEQELAQLQAAREAGVAPTKKPTRKDFVEYVPANDIDEHIALEINGVALVVYGERGIRAVIRALREATNE